MPMETTARKLGEVPAVVTEMRYQVSVIGPAVDLYSDPMPVASVNVMTSVAEPKPTRLSDWTFTVISGDSPDALMTCRLAYSRCADDAAMYSTAVPAVVVVNVV